MGQSVAGGAQSRPSGQAGQGGGNSVNSIPGYASNPHNLPAEFVRSLEAQAVTVPIGADGKQTLDLLVNGDTMSYEPKIIRVKAGVPVHFNLGTKGRDPG
jgi:plastocyanin